MLALWQRLLERTVLHDWRVITAVATLSVALEGLAMGQLTAFRPLFLRDVLQMAPDQVAPWTGVLTSASFSVAFPLAIFWGALARRYSHKLVIVRAHYLEAFAYMLCGWSPGLTLFAVAHVLLGLTFGDVAVIIASVSLLAPDKRVASAIAVIQAGTLLATSLGPPLGALILPFIGLRTLFVLDGVACLVSGSLITFLMPEPLARRAGTSVMRHARDALTLVWRDPRLRWNFAGWFLTRGAMSVVDSYLPVRITELVPGNPAPAIGVIVGLYGVLTTAASWVTGPLLGRIKVTVVFWPAMLIATVSTAGVAVAPWLWLLALSTVVRSIPIGVTGALLYAHLTEVLKGETRAAVLSLTPFPRNASSFALPLASAGASGPFGTLGALLVAVAAYALSIWTGWRMGFPPEEETPVPATLKEEAPV